jgi:hypothetical protein
LAGKEHLQYQELQILFIWYLCEIFPPSHSEKRRKTLAKKEEPFAFHPTGTIFAGCIDFLKTALTILSGSSITSNKIEAASQIG